MLVPDTRKTFCPDHTINTDMDDKKLMNHIFQRLVVKGKKFTKVDFRYSTFDSSYLRDCSFDSCDFTGCKFIGSNFHGSKFSGCTFDYAIFEKTQIDSSILFTECPGHENLKMRFARSLRMNFHQLGDVKAVNSAILIELQAEEEHLRKAYSSTEKYYRKKYVGWERVKMYLEWRKFKLLDSIWGNGEKPLRLFRFFIGSLILIVLVDLIFYRDQVNFSTILQSIKIAPQLYFGVLNANGFDGLFVTSINITRLITFALFMSICIKRLSRR